MFAEPVVLAHNARHPAAKLFAPVCVVFPELQPIAVLPLPVV